MEDLLRDVRYAVRGLRRRPGFSAVVVVTLALGIGANTAIFSVVQAVLLRPLPYPEPERLVRLWSAYPERDVRFGTTSPLDVHDWERLSDGFASIGAWPNVRISGLMMTQAGVPVEMATTYVTDGFFPALGMEALHGRTLGPDDHVEGDDRVVVLSHGAWQRRLGGDPGVVGSTLRLGGDPFVVAGVMPRSFEFPDAGTEVWAPLSLIPESGVPRQRGIRWLNVVGRLASGVALEGATEEMDSIAASLAGQYPDANRQLTSVTVQPLREVIVGDVRPVMLTLFGAVGLVLLIACANVASLVLARSEGRSRELAVRAALGADRGTLVRQLLLESLLLALVGGGVGAALSVSGVQALLGLAPAGIPRLSAVGFDAGVLVFTVVLAVATGLLFGLAPAFRASRPDVHDRLREGGRGASTGARGLRSALVVGEVALVVVLAVGAGLLIRSYRGLSSVDPGFDPEGVLTLRVAARGDDHVSFFQRALERIEALPNVEAAGMIRPLPLAPDTFQGEGITFRLPGTEPPPGQEPEGVLRFTSPGYFEAMGIPRRAGRDFTNRDDGESPPVFVINRAAAERYWPGEDPVGETILAGSGISIEIVGVVGDVRQTGLAEPVEPVFYANHAQISRTGMTLVVRAAGDPSALVSPIQTIIRDLEPDQPIDDIAAMSDVVDRSIARPRFSMTLLSVFAGLALVLAAVGIYGVIAYTVAQRTRELGIRKALGAQRGDVVDLVVRETLRLAVAGLALGLVVAWAAAGWMESMLVGVGARDPWTFAASGVLLAAVALLAAAAPALRAAHTDPMIALRTD